MDYRGHFAADEGGGTANYQNTSYHSGGILGSEYTENVFAAAALPQTPLWELTACGLTNYAPYEP